MIEIRNVCKSFKNNIILNDINMKLEEGNIYGFVGRNGSGKTVLLKIICGLYMPDSGSVLFDGENFNLVRTIVCEENLYNFTQHSFYNQEKDTICFDNWLIRNASNPAIARLEKLLGVPSDTYTTLIYKDLILASSETNPNYTNIIYYNSSQPPIYLEQTDYDNKGYYHFIYNDRLYLIDKDTIYEIYWYNKIKFKRS